MASKQSSQKRTMDTMRSISFAHKYEGKNPSLSAISTIYSNLLVQDAKDEAWLLFHEIASLPLLTTRFEVSCLVGDDGCEMRKKRGTCMHSSVETQKVVELESLDHYLIDRGRRIHGPLIMSYWGRQLADALNASGLATSFNQYKS